MHRRIRSFASCLLFAGALLPMSAVHAHDTRPPDFCPAGGIEMAVSHFSLTPLQLQQYRDAHVAAGQTSPMDCPDKSCGIVDDWFWASAMAMEQCALQEKSLLAKDMPALKVLSPLHFQAPDHHQLYRFKDGLTGACVVCVRAESDNPTY